MNNYLIIRDQNNQKIALVKNTGAVSNGLYDAENAYLTNAEVILGTLPDIITNDKQLFLGELYKNRYLFMVGKGIDGVLEINISGIPFNSDEEAILYYELQ